MPSSRPRRALSGATRVSLLNTGTVMLAALLTAVLALVVEDLLPKADPAARFVAWRWIVTVAVMVLLAMVVWWRSRVHENTGTLFHVQFLDEKMKDLRAQAAAVAASRRMSARSLIRWANLTPDPGTGVADVVAECRELGAALEAAVNGDRDDTGFAVASNMLWPFAFAIGAYLPPHRRMRLVELPREPHGSSAEFPLGVPGGTVRCKRVPFDAATGARVGVWLAFTAAAAKFSPEKFAQFGMSTVYKVTLDEAESLRTLTAAELAWLPAAITDELVKIKNESGGRELVVVAMIPKTVAFAIGWELSRREIRFLHGSHLVHHDPDNGFVPVRVHPSQPATAPRPRPEQLPAAEVRNLTPHPLVVHTDRGELILPAATQPARVTETTHTLRTLELGETAVPLVEATPGHVVNLPAFQPGVLLAVARPVAYARPDRPDLVVPFDEIRAPDGHIIACRALAHLRNET